MEAETLLSKKTFLMEKLQEKIIGVVCGARFPDGCRDEAHRLGLMVIFSSLSRSSVDGKINFDYAIER